MRLPSRRHARHSAPLAARGASFAATATALVLAACGGEASTATVLRFDASPEGKSDAQTGGEDGETTPVDAGHDTRDASADGGAPAMRNSACTPTTEETGTAVSTEHGRLDGTLVYVVDVGQGKQCNGDDSHVHLQVEVSGSIYDVAVDIGTAPNDEVGYYEETLAVPGGAWAEGWHGADSLAYPSLGLHSTSFPTTDPGTVGAQVEALLTTTTKISIFCKGYPQGNGCHDVHYEDGTGEDGAIVLDPTAAMSPVLFFRFSTQTF